MADHAEIGQIELRKQAITIAEGRIMRTEAVLEKLAALANGFESLASGVALAIITPQVAQRLFTFKDRGRSNSRRRQSIPGDVGTIPAFWEAHFHCACGISLGLRPQKRQPLQPGVSLSFRTSASYSPSHLASSPAQ